jgi:hypothetical protein
MVEAPDNAAFAHGSHVPFAVTVDELNQRSECCCHYSDISAERRLGNRHRSLPSRNGSPQFFLFV